VSDWIDNDPEAQQHLQAASMLLEQQGKINDLRARESALAHALLAWRHEADSREPGRRRTANIPVNTAALALGLLLRWCDATPLPALEEWLQDRVAAADLADLLDARDAGTASVWVDARTIDRAHALLCRLIDQGAMPDMEVAELAAIDLANALNTLGEDAP
jgi:hypothetical protein